MAFKSLGLNDRLVQGILATGFTAPTEIQSRAIPSAVAGRDVIGCAQTGTGKTAAFTLPILNRLADRTERSNHVKALVLTPTRELAQQVEDSVQKYGQFLTLRTLSVYGGTNIQNQLKRLSRGIDILIATPGRLIDHLERKSVDLSKTEVLVLDEADRMFDMGFIDDVRRIISYIPRERQTLLFSATMSKQVRSLAKDIQSNPDVIEVGESRSAAVTVTQHFYSIPEEQKMDLLLHILKEKELDSVLVFSKTKAGAEKISQKLYRSGIKAVSIHSDRTQSQRQHALAGFKQGRFRVMVATDVAARGIHVEGISHVINFDIPSYAEDYIHRIGRTGRAQSTGDAITFVGRGEIRHVKKIEQFTRKHITIAKYPGFIPPVPSAAAAEETAAPHREHREYKREHKEFKRDHKEFKREHKEFKKDRPYPSRPTSAPLPAATASIPMATEENEDDGRQPMTSEAPPVYARSQKEYHQRPFEPRRERSGDRKSGFKKERSGGKFSSSRPFTKRSNEGGYSPRPFNKRSGESGSSPRPFNKRSGESGFSPRPFNKRSGEPGISPRPFNKRSNDSGFSPRPFKKRTTDSDFQQRPFSKPSGFAKFRKDKPFGSKRTPPPSVHKREHTATKQETFSANGNDAPSRSFGPDWRTILPEERQFKKREHKVVPRMVKRKKKDS